MQTPDWNGNPHSSHQAVAGRSVDERTDFIQKTYAHLLLAVGAFITLEYALLNTPGIERLAIGMTSGWTWLLVLAAFMFVSQIANTWAQSATSLGMQYAGLGLYVVAQAVIFVPLLYIVSYYGGPDVIAKAGVMTGIVFAGLTAYVMLTRRDLSFMGGTLTIIGFGALGLIVVSILFGFSLGSWFAILMVLFAAGAILYETSNILHVYRPGQHVAAALALFASVALLFWYLLQFMNSRD